MPAKRLLRVLSFKFCENPFTLNATDVGRTGTDSPEGVSHVVPQRMLLVKLHNVFGTGFDAISFITSV
jgi:hypothetical protein